MNETADFTFRLANPARDQYPPMRKVRRHQDNHRVDAHEQVVSHVAQNRDPAMVSRHLIELVAVNQQ